MMHKSITVCIALSMMMLVTVEVQATHYFFNNGGGDNLWTNPDNWGNRDGSPLDLGYPGESVPFDVVIARDWMGQRALITDGMEITFAFFTMWSNPYVTYTGGVLDGFDMTGGMVNLVGGSGILEMGSNGDNIPIEVNTSGGTITGNLFTLGGVPSATGTDIDSDATWNISGTAVAEFSLSGQIGHTHPEVQMSTGTLNMSGDGMLTVEDLILSATGNGLVTIADNAKIITRGDDTVELDDFISQGWITGPGVQAVYDAGLDQTTVMVTGGPPGDFDGDGDVDGDDFLVWQTGFGTIYDGDDFLIWQQNFSTPGSGTGSGAVPEPSSGGLALIVAALLGQVARHRRRRPIR